MTLELDQFGFLTRPTLSLLESYGEYDNAVLYAVLHEPIYCQGYSLHSHNTRRQMLTKCSTVEKLLAGLRIDCVLRIPSSESRTILSPRFISPEKW